eukprot:3714943-Rhodomonas_salina.1
MRVPGTKRTEKRHFVVDLGSRVPAAAWAGQAAMNLRVYAMGLRVSPTRIPYAYPIAVPSTDVRLCQS